MIPQTSCCSITPQALESIRSSAAEVPSNAMLGILVYWPVRKYFSSIHKRTCQDPVIVKKWRAKNELYCRTTSSPLKKSTAPQICPLLIERKDAFIPLISSDRPMQTPAAS
ncbi:hypothetical protein QQF64_011971 [Cirrhinus molitorella]|uniref:Uncharacterized protein n=1 Tax=Cirrhinus molitorella TaxID=172907 RepID=A0ABR3LWH3_9TELE